MHHLHTERTSRSPGGVSEPPYLLAAALVAASLFLFPVNNPDLFWHLSAGRELLRLGGVPAKDWLSWSRAGEPWLDFESLSQLVYVALYGAAGLAGIWLFKALLFAGTAGAALATARLDKTKPREEAVVLLALSLGLIPSLNPRPENFSLLFFALELWFLEARRREAPRLTKGREALLAAAFFSLWAGLHGGFVYGLALLAAYALIPFSFSKFLDHAHLLGAGLAGSLANPLGPGVYQAIALHARLLPLLQEYLIEWRPVTTANQWEWPYLGLLAVTAAAAAWRWWRGRALPGVHLAVLAALALASLRHSRDTAYFCVAAAALLPSILGSRARPGLSRLAPALVAGAIAFCALEAWPRLLRDGTWTESEFPVGAARFLKAEAGVLSPHRLYNPWGWGGYLGFELAPPYKVMLDGRYLFHEDLKTLRQAQSSDRDWQSYLDANKIDVALLEASPQTFYQRPFYVFFMPSQRWALVYWDSNTLLFVRRGSVSDAWLAAKEFQVLWPGDLERVGQALRAGQLDPSTVRREIGRVPDPGLAGGLNDWLRSIPLPAAPTPPSSAARIAPPRGAFGANRPGL